MSASIDAQKSVVGPVLISLACDYITATAKTKDAVMRLHSLATGLFRFQRDLGNESRPWGMAGFSGFKCGSVQIGTRDSELIVRLSSDSAANGWSRLMDHAENVSRFDLQATVKIESDVQRAIDKYKKAARRNSSQGGDRKRVRWIQEHHGGYTLYVGNRQSNVFGRVYDKHAESPMVQYENCIRFEAQYQNKLAHWLARDLKSVSSPMPSFAAYLTQFFSGRGVDLQLPYKAEARYSCSRPRSDHEKCLAWLAGSVRPSVMRLIDAGKGEQVLRALGLVTDATE